MLNKTKDNSKYIIKKMPFSLAQWYRDNNYVRDGLGIPFEQMVYDIITLDETKEWELYSLFHEYFARVRFPFGFGGKAYAMRFYLWLIGRNNHQDADKWGYLFDRAREITRRRTGYYERPAQLLLENKTPDDG